MWLCNEEMEKRWKKRRATEILALGDLWGCRVSKNLSPIHTCKNAVS
jgi:hypothetical protein